MDELKTSTESKQFIIIKTDEEYFGIDISYVSGIERLQRITRVPKAQKHFTGIINLRGEILPVMSLRRKIGLADDVFKKSTRIVIMNLEPKYSVGIIVENVLEVIALELGQIEMFTGEEDKDSYVYGIGKYDDKLISLLDVQKIILQ